MLGFLKGFVRFWYDFIVGDDWTVAVGVVIVLMIGGVVARSTLESIAWLIVPIGVMLLLSVSLLRVARPH